MGKGPQFKRKEACIHNELSFSLQKQGNLVICDNMDKPEGQCSKQNKPGTERQILQELTYMWNLQWSTS